MADSSAAPPPVPEPVLPTAAPTAPAGGEGTDPTTMLQPAKLSKNELKRRAKRAAKEKAAAEKAALRAAKEAAQPKKAKAAVEETDPTKYKQNREAALQAVTAAGGNPYPHKFCVSHRLPEFVAAFEGATEVGGWLVDQDAGGVVLLLCVAVCVCVGVYQYGSCCSCVFLSSVCSVV